MDDTPPWVRLDARADHEPALGGARAAPTIDLCFGDIVSAGAGTARLVVEPPADAA